MGKIWESVWGRFLLWFGRIHSFIQQPGWHRVPVLLQLSSTECGATCLTMILRYYGHKVRISECRDRIGVGRDGISVGSIVKAARTYGLQVKAYSAILSRFHELPLPVIVYWGFNHFVIVECWSAHYITIIDPAFGRRMIPISEFSQHFTGIVITFTPDSHFQRCATSRSSRLLYLRRVLTIPGFKNLFIQLISTTLLLEAIGLIIALFTKILIDSTIPQKNIHVLLILAAGIIAVVLTQFVSGYIRMLALQYLQAHIDAKMTLGFLRHLLHLPFDFFLRRTSGDLLLRLESSSIIRDILTNQMLSILLDGSLVLVYLLVLFWQSPFFGELVSIIALLQIGVLFISRRKIHETTQKYLIAQAKSQSFAVQLLRGIATIKAVGSEDAVFDSWANLYFRELQESMRRSKIFTVIALLLGMIRSLAMLSLLWVGAWLVIDQRMSLGTMLALNTLAMTFLAPVASLVNTSQQLQLVGSHIERMEDVLETAPEQVTPSTYNELILHGEIELKNVSFRYDTYAPFVLSDISITIAPGQKVAIVGASGSGKTSLALLLLGIHPTTSGQVYYDNHLLSSLNYQQVRRQCGVVLQELFLYSGTIFENISLCDPELTIDGAMAAAQLAHIHDDIMNMPMRYETILSEDGAGLSGGQRQRITLARALVHRPRILVLDEATSHLDATTEAIVDHNLNQLACTRIIIAHRLSTVLNADIIVVLDQGRIVGKGTHQELFTTNILYADLVRNQLRDGETMLKSVS